MAERRGWEQACAWLGAGGTGAGHWCEGWFPAWRGVGGVVRVAADHHLQLIFAQPEEGGVMDSHISCHCVVGGQIQISCSMLPLLETIRTELSIF